MDLEEAWRIREEEIYPALFGHSGRGIFTLSQDLFADQFRQADVDPRWLFYGVIEFAPTATRPSWLYVTSGHSNPWEDEPRNHGPSGESGAGIEFTLAASERGDWAIRTLQSMLAFDLLLCTGRYPGRSPLAPNDRIPLRGPVNGHAECLLRNLIVTEAEGIQSEFQLPSGKVRLMGFTAVTDAELDEGKAVGSANLLGRLRAAGCHPVNNPARGSL